MAGERGGGGLRPMYTSSKYHHNDFVAKIILSFFASTLWELPQKEYLLYFVENDKKYGQPVIQFRIEISIQ